MAVDKLVDSTQLDADLTSVANAIRTKGGTSAQLAFPAGFLSAIQAIPSEGGWASDEGSLVLAADYDYTRNMFLEYTGLVIQTSLNKIILIALWSEEWANQTAERPCGGAFLWLSTDDTGVPRMTNDINSSYYYGAGYGTNATTGGWYGPSNQSGPITHKYNSSVPAGSFGFRTHSAVYPFKAGHTLKWKVWGV